MLSSPLVLSVTLGIIAVAASQFVRPIFATGLDAQWIRTIMSSPFSADDLGYNAFSVVAEFYSRLGMADRPLMASIFGTVVGSAVLAVVLFRVNGAHIGRMSMVLAVLTPFLIGTFEGTYAKEVLISLGMMVVVLLPVNLIGEVLVILTLVFLGAEFRTYWLIIAVLYVILRLILSRRQERSVMRVVWMIVLLSVLTGLAVWIGTGGPADQFRTHVNHSIARQTETGSLITRFIDAPEPVGGILNATLTSLSFIIPLPMVLKFSPYYLVISVVFALIWISAVRTATVAGRPNPLLTRFSALPLAFLIVQGLFEPDWGSALRHLTPLMPLIVGAMVLTERRQAEPPTNPPSDHTSTARPTPPQRRNSMSSRSSISPSSSTGGTARTVLTDYLVFFRRWWWMLIVGLLLGAVIGGIGSAMMTKQYSATAQLYVGTATTGGSSDAYNGVMLSQKQVGTYASIASSRVLGQQVVDDLHLDKSADEVAGMITAGAYKDTVILDLHVTSDNPELSRDIANSAAVRLQETVHNLNIQTSPEGQSGAPQIAVLNQAEAPSSPSSPNTVLYIVGGLVLGLILGALAAVVKGLTDRRITDAATLRDVVDAPLIGTISTSDSLAQNHKIDFAAASTPSAEQLRELRTNLRFLDVDNAPKILSVTSGLPGTGKTTLALNLALALADDGENVILVDADLRTPSLVSYMGGNLQSAVGLSTALSGAADLQTVIQGTSVEGLDIVTSGPVPPNPAELLGSRSFGELLSQLSSHYDHVIVDASPVLPVTDGALVAAAADGVILTVRYRETTFDQLIETVSNLDSVNARVIGTVFTRTPANSSKKYGYGTTDAASHTGTAGPFSSTAGPDTPRRTKAAHALSSSDTFRE